MYYTKSPWRTQRGKPDRTQPRPQILLVPVLRLVRVGSRFALLPHHALMRVCKRQIHVNLIDDVRHVERREAPERPRRILSVALHDDRHIWVDFAYRLRRTLLERPEVAPRSLVHVENDLHAALHRLRQHKRIGVVKFVSSQRSYSSNAPLPAMHSVRDAK